MNELELLLKEDLAKSKIRLNNFLKEGINTDAIIWERACINQIEIVLFDLYRIIYRNPSTTKIYDSINK